SGFEDLRLLYRGRRPPASSPGSPGPEVRARVERPLGGVGRSTTAGPGVRPGPGLRLPQPAGVRRRCGPGGPGERAPVDRGRLRGAGRVGDARLRDSPPHEAAPGPGGTAP